MWHTIRRGMGKDGAVNCWFCNQDNNVPVSKTNQWTCLTCKQHNHFNKDRDYTIENLTTSGYDSGNMDRYRFSRRGRYTGQVSLRTQPAFCEDCCRKQRLKISALNSFEPAREVSWQHTVHVCMLYMYLKIECLHESRSKKTLEWCHMSTNWTSKGGGGEGSIVNPL